MSKQKISVTKTHPGTEQIVEALGYSIDAVRALAGLRGCPLVKGGRGFRFVSVDAFREWVGTLTLEQRLRVKPFASALKDELLEEIGKLAWGIDSGEWTRLKRKGYHDLVKVRDWWLATVERDKARGGAQLVLVMAGTP